MIDEENNSTDIEELKDDEDLDLEDAINQLQEGNLLEEPEASSQEQTEPIASTQESTSEGKGEGLGENLAGAATQKISALMSDVITLKQQLEDRNGQYTRLYADFDNFRRRTEREKEEEEGRLSAKILKKFLPVVDDFERAQSQIKPKTDAESSIHNSYQSVYKQLVKCLKELGIDRMRPVGQEFDPNYHEAIAQEPNDEYDEGIVMEELRAGFRLGDRILRHALVKVSAGKTGNGSGSSAASSGDPEAVKPATEADSLSEHSPESQA